jgi:hypothetical protein
MRGRHAQCIYYMLRLWLTYTDVWSGVLDADYVGVLEMWADRQPCRVKGRGKRSLSDAASGRACSVFFLRPAFGRTTIQACSWRAWVLGDEHAGHKHAVLA